VRARGTHAQPVTMVDTAQRQLTPVTRSFKQKHQVHCVSKNDTDVAHYNFRPRCDRWGPSPLHQKWAQPLFPIFSPCLW